MNINPAKAAVVVGKLVPNPKGRLREQFHEVARFKYLALRTEETYWQWVVRYLKFHRRPGTPTPDPSKEGNKPDGWQHPKDIGGPEVGAFLSDLANRQQVDWGKAERLKC